MDDKQLLVDAMHEIQDLRRRNEILSAKAEVIEIFACALLAPPYPRSLGAAPDVAWALQKKIDEITESRKPPMPSTVAKSEDDIPF